MRRFEYRLFQICALAPLQWDVMNAASADAQESADQAKQTSANCELQARIAEGKLSMSVDAEQQVVKLGTSTDMGFCRSRKKVTSCLLLPTMLALIHTTDCADKTRLALHTPGLYKLDR